MNTDTGLYYYNYPPPEWRYSTDGQAEIEWQEGTPTIVFGDCIFIRQCPRCGRFVTADESVFVNEEFGPKNVPNATCKKHGRVKMPFEGWASEYEAY